MSRRRFMFNKYPEGLLHLWRLNGNLLDAVGGADGVADGTITYPAGLFSTCARLRNAANIIVNLDHVLNQYTVQAWVKCESWIEHAPIIFSRTSDADPYGPIFEAYNSSSRTIALYATNNSRIYWNCGSYANWQLYTFTCDGNSVKCYINAVQQYIEWTTESTNKYLKLRNNTRIGRDTISSDRNLNGYMQQLMIWNKALSQSEISMYYNNGKGFVI